MKDILEKIHKKFSLKKGSDGNEISETEANG